MHLVVLEQGQAMAAQGRDIEGERQAAEDHEQHGDPVHRRLRPVREGSVGGGEAARGDERPSNG